MQTTEMPSPKQIAGAELLTVLVVEDEKAVREGCRDAAQLNGFQTQTAESAGQAYKLLDTQPVDIVLLDLSLPGACGLENRVVQERHTPRAGRSNDSQAAATVPLPPSTDSPAPRP